MALRLARGATSKLHGKMQGWLQCLISIGAIRPQLNSAPRALPCVSTHITSRRYASNVPTEDPKKKAQSILDSLPGNNLISKTAILSAGAGLSVFGISNEFLVVNEETVVAFCILSVFWAVGKYGGPMYKEWADGQVSKQNSILNAARDDHTSAVKSRIENVKQLGSVIDVTKQLFEVSKVWSVGDFEVFM